MKVVILERHPMYEIFDCGCIVSNTMRKKGGLLKHRSSPDGYARVVLDKLDYRVHRLVAEAFLDTWDKDLEVNHKDGNKLNNHVSNLEMVTHGQNMAHALQNNLYNFTSVRGEKCHMTKLNERIVKQIRDLASRKVSYKVIAELTGAKPKNIGEIVNKRSWKHLL